MKHAHEDLRAPSSVAERALDDSGGSAAAQEHSAAAAR